MLYREGKREEGSFLQVKQIVVTNLFRQKIGFRNKKHALCATRLNLCRGSLNKSFERNGTFEEGRRTGNVFQTT